MTDPVAVEAVVFDPAALAALEGRIAVILDEAGRA